MAKNKLLILLFCSFIFQISCRFFICPEAQDPPQALDNTKYTLQPVERYQMPLTPVVISDKVLLNNKDNWKESTKDYYKDSTYCPTNYVIVKKEDLESVIKFLGDKAYSTFTDKNGLDMSENIYYITNTKGNGDYNKIFMILKNGEIFFEDFDPAIYISDWTSTQKFSAICKLIFPEPKIIFPDDKVDFDFGTQLILKTNSDEYFSDVIWKINDEIIKTKNASITLNESDVNNLQFWGKTVIGEMKYLCELLFVSKEKIPNDQTYDDSKIRKIKTDFKMYYSNALHFTTSSCPVAPRDDGGYYIAVATETDTYLHILSFDKNDNMIKDFDTKEKARPFDITATQIGFAVYVMNATNRNHSFITLYDKEFNKVNRVTVMNNDPGRTAQEIGSTPEKQIMRFNSKNETESYMRFIYQADNAKLTYSRGRIFLVFAHYNMFSHNWQGHNADTIVTFNDNLEDIDFGYIWGASHSLIQSVTFDNDYFWEATLSDAYPNGIRVTYVSKTEFTNNFDGVNNKNNIRVKGATDELAGYIKGYQIGWADGKLGSILYFEELELYCLVYAKTPNYSEDAKNGTNIIYMTTWKFSNKKIDNIITKEIKIFPATDNIMQVRAGKYGKDKVIIIYLGTKSQYHNYYGNVPKGSVPNYFVVRLPSFKFIVDDAKIDTLLMNPNEELKTFRNGALIWANADSDSTLSIIKIGDNERIAVVPSITWRDIYKLNMNEEKKVIDGKEIYGPTIFLRGLTSSQIDYKHTFTIILTFNKKRRLRNLDDDGSTLQMEAICQVVEPVEGTSNSVNMVDYECIGNHTTSEDLTQYQFDNIIEGDNENSLKKSNLEEEITKIKEKYGGDLNKLTTVTTPTFKQEDLDKIVIFEMNEKITNITANQFKFNFKIDGKLSRDIITESKSINKDFDLVEIDTKANCIFEIGENKAASLSCNLDVNDHKNITEFSFKTSEIVIDNNNEVYLSKFNDIALINIEEKQEEEEDDDNNKTIIIAVCVICVVVVATGVIVTIYLIKRKPKASGNETDEKEIKDKNIRQTNEAMNEDENGNKVIEFKN